MRAPREQESYAVQRTRKLQTALETDSGPRGPIGLARFLAPLALVGLFIALGSTAGAAISDEDIAGLASVGSKTGSLAPIETSFSAMMFRFLLALGAVVGLIFAVSWAAKKYLPANVVGGRGGPIEIVSTRSIGPRKSLMLVRVQDKTILLGNTSTGIQFLTDIDHGRGGWEEAAVQSGLSALQTAPVEDAS